VTGGMLFLTLTFSAGESWSGIGHFTVCVEMPNSWPGFTGRKSQSRKQHPTCNLFDRVPV